MHANVGGVIKHAWCEGSTRRGSARTPSVPKPICAPAKSQVKTLGHDAGDSLVARGVLLTTANGGGTAPVHARKFADDGGAINHAWPRQRDRRRSAITPAVVKPACAPVKHQVNMRRTHMPVAALEEPPPTVAELRPCTQARAPRRRHRRRRQTRVMARHTQTPAAPSNSRGGDSIRGQW